MVAKKSAGKKSSRVKVGKLKLTKETVKTLPGSELKKIKGGVIHYGRGIAKKTI
jgi:hypothetical protein